MKKIMHKIAKKIRPVKEQWNLNGVGTAIAALFSSALAILVLVGAYHLWHCDRRDWLLNDCQSRVAQSQRWYEDVMAQSMIWKDSLKQERLANQGLMKLLANKAAEEHPGCGFMVEAVQLSDSTAFIAGYWIIPNVLDSTEFDFSKEYDSITVTVKADNCVIGKKTTHKCEERSSNACEEKSKTDK